MKSQENTAQNLCLHYLDPSGARRLALTPHALRALIAERIDRGERPAALTDYLRGALPPTSFTLSFDDAHASVLRHGVEVLAEHHVPGTLFVPTAMVGSSEEYLSWDELRALRDLGWTLGSHTVHHPRMSWRLYAEDPTGYAARLDEECARSRETLERELGVQITLFAYPYGEAPPQAREAVQRAGYLLAFTVRESLAWDGDPLLIPRLDGMPSPVVTPGDDSPLCISVVVPACDRVEILSEVLQRLSNQSYPAERFEVLVVDDGSREDLRRALPQDSSNIRLIESAGRPGVFGAGAARQRGADLARFETVAFLDADIAVGRDFLWHIDWVHQRIPRAAMLGYLSGYNLHDLGMRHTLEDLRGLDELDGALAVIPDRSREPSLRSCLDNLDWLPEPWQLCYTGNLSLSRALLRDVGGFSSDFSGWGLEDLDLGVRLSNARAQWVFSRFAVGYHLLDPEEGSPRNPFRRERPTLEDFRGYLVNLETLRGRYPNDRSVQRFCDRSLGDVRETCSRPDTTGIELGAGVPLYEALDRVAYARKVGARRIYLLGADPEEYPGYLTVLREAKAAGIPRFTLEMSTRGLSSEPMLSEAMRAGVDRAVVRAESEGSSGVIAALERLGASGIAVDLVIARDAPAALSLRSALAETVYGSVKVTRA